MDSSNELKKYTTMRVDPSARLTSEMIMRAWNSIDDTTAFSMEPGSVIPIDDEEELESHLNAWRVWGMLDGRPSIEISDYEEVEGVENVLLGVILGIVAAITITLLVVRWL